MKPSFLLVCVLVLQPVAALADCIEGAARNFGTDANVLRAIAIVESHVRPHAVRHNINGSTDRGLFQINSVHLPELARAGIMPADLHDVCLSSNVAAMLLRRKIERFGDNWIAVGSYHSTVPAKRDYYIGKVRKVYDGILALQSGHAHGSHGRGGQAVVASNAREAR